jgi:hypothetical protein
MLGPVCSHLGDYFLIRHFILTIQKNCNPFDPPPQPRLMSVWYVTLHVVMWHSASIVTEPIVHCDEYIYWIVVRCLIALGSVTGCADRNNMLQLTHGCTLIHGTTVKVQGHRDASSTMRVDGNMEIW